MEKLGIRSALGEVRFEREDHPISIRVFVLFVHRFLAGYDA